MSSIQKEIKIKVPAWMTWLYGMMSLWLVPWIAYLQITLPEQRFSLPWRAIWVTFDLALLAMSLAATYFLRKKSLWASLVLAALAALCMADAWFDIMTSQTASDSEKLVAVAIDLFLEVPLAFLSLWCAAFLLRQVMTSAQGREEARQ